MSKITSKRVIVWFMPILLSIFVGGCGSGGDSILGSDTIRTTTIVPSVVDVVPENSDTNVSYNIKSITAEFSIPMLSSTLNSTTFTLFDGNVSKDGNVTYENRVAELTLDANLSINTLYTATITTGAKSAQGTALANNFVWTFTTGATADTTRPTVFSTSPINGATGVLITKTIAATFSEAMKASSITATVPSTFSVKETITSDPVDGNVTYAVVNKTASFNPTLDLAADMNYTATITTVAKDLAGNAMLNDYNWTFRTAAGPITPLVDFGLAEPFGIASAAGVTNTDTVTDKTRIDADVVLNPTPTCNAVQTTSGVDGTFGLCNGMAPILTFGHEVITQIYPDTTTADAVRADLHQAYLDITPASMPSTTTLTASATYGAVGTVMTPNVNHFTTGVYESASTINIANDLTLDAGGNANATFVFQAGSALNVAPNTRILLVGGAKASNVYWQVGSSATLGNHTVWNGNILAAASITMEDGTDSCGRLFAGATIDSGAFTFQSNLISVPGNSALIAGCE